MIESPFKGKTGLRRLINALYYSRDGFKSAYQHEDAIRMEVWSAMALIPLALYLGNSAIARAMMLASLILVIIVELINSSIEATVDHTSLEKHPLAKRAKDIGSAAVLLSLINLGVVWGLIVFG
ncbi:MAG: diacylglycerol kinase [Methylophilaceae bacterium]